MTASDDYIGAILERSYSTESLYPLRTFYFHSADNGAKMCLGLECRNRGFCYFIGLAVNRNNFRHSGLGGFLSPQVRRQVLAMEFVMFWKGDSSSVRR